MFLKKKYVLVKHEHEVNLISKLLIAIVILVTLIGTPILLQMFVQFIQGDKEIKSNNSTEHCHKRYGCHKNVSTSNDSIEVNVTIDELFYENSTEYAVDNQTQHSIDDDASLEKESSGILNDFSSTVIPLSTENDYSYDYTNDYFDFKPDEKLEEEKTWLTTEFPVSTQDVHIVNSNITATIVDDFFNSRKDYELSTLGNILFKGAKLPPAREKEFKILVWKDGPFLHRRHINFFSGISHDPFAECSVKNCKLSYNTNDMSSADAVVFLLLRITPDSMPDSSVSRSPEQRWIFLSDENPYNTFLDKTLNWSNYSGMFNWSMTYRMESDVPVPNGRVIALEKQNEKSAETLKELIPNKEVKQRNVLMSVILNDCSLQNPVTAYIMEMKKYLDVDVYGKCGNLTDKCPTHFAKDCPELNKYLFYFSFENAICKEFMSQKFFWNSYEKGAVPIIAGVSMNDCKTILPPNSYLHIGNFYNAEDLANHILKTNATYDENYLKLHEWRNNFKVVNEHGYFGSHSFHYCRICEALNYNDDGVKVYDDLSKFLNPANNCNLQ